MADIIEIAPEVVNGDTLTLTPKEDGVTLQENSSYVITIKGLVSQDGKKTLPTTRLSITTSVSPMYCTLASVKSLVATFNIPDTDILSYIRDASNYADFIASENSTSSSTTNTTLDFAKEQFTRVKALIDCLVRGVINQSVSSGDKYTLDVASIEENADLSSLTKLLDLLKPILKKWQDAIRGYYNEGRAAPVATRIGLKSDTNSDVTHTTVDKILNDFTRTPPEGNG